VSHPFGVHSVTSHPLWARLRADLPPVLDGCYTPITSWGGCRYNRSMMRMIGLLFGIPILLIGFMWIAIAAGLSAENRNLFHSPLMATCGALCLWLGYRLIFTKPVKPAPPRLRRPPVSN
jgi:hypothetical protein